MIICEKSDCTGCGACFNICNVSAISMVADAKGFLYPSVDEGKCVNCAACVKTCPMNNEMELKKNSDIFAALARDDSLREKSSSGGLFSVLAQFILKNHGVVYGCAMDENLHASHIRVDKVDCLEKLRGSKYVQSEIWDLYKTIRNDLEENITVLFCGTACQIAGLYSFLKKDNDNLLTVDVLCHGAPSPIALKKYLENEEKVENSLVKKIDFRKKHIGWSNYFVSIIFDNSSKKESVYFQNEFMSGFLGNFYLRESCYSCHYARQERIGDISLGDYWGYKESYPEYIENDDRGISAVFVNTEKGKRLFKKIENKIDFANRTIDDVKNGNSILCHPSAKPEAYESFWREFENLSFSELSKKYFPCEREFHDYMSDEDRAYFGIPYNRRHLIHVLRCKKNNALKKLKGD